MRAAEWPGFLGLKHVQSSHMQETIHDALMLNDKEDCAVRVQIPQPWALNCERRRVLVIAECRYMLPKRKSLAGFGHTSPVRVCVKLQRTMIGCNECCGILRPRA
jgi:hypothetical protein